MPTYYPASVLSHTIQWMFDGGNGSDLSARVCVRFDQENGVTDRETCPKKSTLIEITKPYKVGFVLI